MTTIRRMRKAGREADVARQESLRDVARPLASPLLHGRRGSLGPAIAGVSALAALAALAVVGWDLWGDRPMETKPALIEAPAPGPAAAESSRPRPAPPIMEALRPALGADAGPAATASITTPAPSALIIEPPAATPRVPPRQQSAPAVPRLALSQDEIAAHLARGEERLKAGEVAAARLFFERVALSGDARGALGMARTYDPAVLAKLPVLGAHADAAAAGTWYERAAAVRGAPSANDEGRPKPPSAAR
jgi:hypothetical protein